MLSVGILKKITISNIFDWLIINISYHYLVLFEDGKLIVRSIYLLHLAELHPSVDYRTINNLIP